MQLIDVNITAVYDEATNCYDIPIFIGGVETHIKFDTGASSGVISSSFFREDLTDEMIENIQKYFETRDDVQKREFSSSAGKKDLVGYLVDAGEINLGGVLLKHLFYYFIPKNGRPLALLGNDFLHNCEFTHSIGGNIVISKIDIEKYYETGRGALSGSVLANYIDGLVDNHPKVHKIPVIFGESPILTDDRDKSITGD